MNIERDVLDRLEDLGLRWYLTGSWALAAYAEPRMTRAIDVVLELTPLDYESSVRPTFDGDFLVNDPIDLGGRWMGGLIHRTELVRVDLMFGRTDAWARSAMERRRSIDHRFLLRRLYPDLGRPAARRDHDPTGGSVAGRHLDQLPSAGSIARLRRLTRSGRRSQAVRQAGTHSTSAVYE